MVGKVFKDEASYKKERAEVDRLSAIDPRHDFTVPVMGDCVVQRNPIDEPDLKKCQLISKSKSASFHELIFKNGGYALSALYERTKPGKTAPTVYFDDIIRRILPVMTGISELTKKGFVHLDIKPPNMLYDAASQKMYLIDFGIMTECRQLKREDFYLRSSYPYFPPEFKTLYTLWYMKMVKRDSDDIKKWFLENFGFLVRPQFEPWLDTHWPSRNYMGDLDAAIRSMMSKPLKELVKDFDTTFTKVIDAYGLGISMVSIRYFLECNQKLQVRSAALVDSAMRDVFFPLMHPNPYMRLPMDEAIKRLEAILHPGAAPGPSAAPALARIPDSVLLNPPQAPTPVRPLSLDKWLQMPPKERETQLEQLGLPKSGTKAVQCARLVQATQGKADRLKEAIAIDDAARQAAQAERAEREQAAAQRAAAAEKATMKTFIDLTTETSSESSSQNSSQPVLVRSPSGARRLYRKSLKDCNKSEDKGGYPIKELRKIAKDIGLKNKMKRKEICDELKGMEAP